MWLRRYNSPSIDHQAQNISQTCWIPAPSFLYATFHTFRFHFILDVSPGCASFPETRLQEISSFLSGHSRRRLSGNHLVLVSNMQGAKIVTNVLRPIQNGRRFADDVFKYIFLNNNVWIPMKFHCSLFLRVQLTIPQRRFRSWLGAVKATSHYLNQWWLDYLRIYASLGLNKLTHWVTWLLLLTWFNSNSGNDK